MPRRRPSGEPQTKRIRLSPGEETEESASGDEDLPSLSQMLVTASDLRNLALNEALAELRDSPEAAPDCSETESESGTDSDCLVASDDSIQTKVRKHFLHGAAEFEAAAVAPNLPRRRCDDTPADMACLEEASLRDDCPRLESATSLGPVWFAGKGSKAQMVARATQHKHTIQLQRHVHRSTWETQQLNFEGKEPPVTNEFGSYRDVSAFLAGYDRLPEKRRGYYECYTEDAPCRLIADYEAFVGTALDAPPTPMPDALPTPAEQTEAAQRLASFKRHLAWAVKEVTGVAYSALPGCEIRSDSSRRKTVDGHAGAFWRPSMHLTHTGLVFPDGMLSQAKLWELVEWHGKYEQDRDLFYRKPHKPKIKVVKFKELEVGVKFKNDELVIDTRAPYCGGQEGP